MLVWKKILWLRERIREQKKWIEACGGNLTGYIANYGDPGVPPINKETGRPKIVWVPTDKQYLVQGHLEPAVRFDLENGRVLVDLGEPDRPWHLPYLARHSGDGGTKIYEADLNRLRSWERELDDLCVNCHAARLRADEEEALEGCKR